jgi:multimeric flavodoxin WrbA
MKIIAIVGSPRHGGNTDTLVDHIIAGAQNAGATVTKYFLHDMNIRPCQGCNGCRPEVEKPCVIQDDMQLIHRHLRDCDAVILGTPIYAFAPSAQLTIFLNRGYALGGDGPRKSVRTALALAYGNPDPLASGAINAYRIIRECTNWSGGVFVGLVHTSSGKLAHDQTRPQILSQAEALGRSLATP